MSTTAAVDDVIMTLGWWGRYQKIQFIGLNLHLIVTSFHIMSIVFIGREADHRCATVSDDFLHQLSSTGLNTTSVNHLSGQYNTTADYSTCSVKVKDNSGRVIWTGDCPNGYQYSEARDRTIVSEWDLVCEKEALSDVSQTVFAVGQAVGAAFFPTMADRFGRKPLYMASHILIVLSAVVTAFAPDILTFMALRFFAGAAQQGVGLVAWVMIIELLPTKYRHLAAQVGLIVWPVGLLNLGFIGWLTRSLSWRTTQLISTGLSAYIIVQWWLSDETLRWLIANNKEREAENIIRRAAKQNKASVSRVMDVFNSVMHPEPEVVPLTKLDTPDNGENGTHDQRLTAIQTKAVRPNAVEEVSLLEALKNKNVLKVTAISAYNWFAGSAIYYGLIMTSGTLIDDLYLGYAVNIMVEIPAGIVFLLLINRMNRRSNVAMYHTITGVSLLLSVMLTTIPAIASLPGAKLAAIVVSLLGKFAIAAGYGAMWLYTPEYFPTNIRNTCFGISSLAARVGAMVAPFARTLARHIPWLPGLIFSTMCFLILAVTWFLPETFNRELPQTIADMERLMEDNRSKPKTENQGEAKC